MLIEYLYDRHKKARTVPGFLVSFRKDQELLDLCFLVHDVLSNNWIEFLHFQLASHGSLVLGRCVEVSSAR